MFFRLNITQLWSGNDETKMHAGPADSFTFYSSLSPFCLQSFGAVEVWENILHLAKFAICKQCQTNTGSSPVPVWPQSCLKTLFAVAMGNFCSPLYKDPFFRTEGKCLCCLCHWKYKLVTEDPGTQKGGSVTPLCLHDIYAIPPITSKRVYILSPLWYH